MAFHVNNETGITGRCQAIIRCPFGLPLDEHFQTEEEARAAYEVKMSSFVITSYQRETMEKLRNISAEVLRKTSLKEMNASQLSQCIMNEVHDLEMDRALVSSAIDLASILHSKQSRGNRGNFEKTPYIEHPLRNGLRLIRLGVRDQDVIVAAILHDTIEDGSNIFIEKFSETSAVTGELESRKELSNYINEAYGHRVLVMVEAVTNDYMTATDKSRLSLEKKREIYRKHVEKNINNNFEVLLVKISDFIDNASGLYHNDIPSRREKTYKQAVKYLPVTDVFIKELQNTKTKMLSQDSIDDLIRRMKVTSERLRKIIQSHT